MKSKLSLPKYILAWDQLFTSTSAVTCTYPRLAAFYITTEDHRWIFIKIIHVKL